METLNIIDGAASTKTYAVLAKVGNLELAVRPMLGWDYERSRSGEMVPDAKQVRTVAFRVHIHATGTFEGNPASLDDGEFNGLDPAAFGVADIKFRTKSEYLTRVIALPFAYQDTRNPVAKERLQDAASALVDNLVSRAVGCGATLASEVSDVKKWVLSSLNTTSFDDDEGGVNDVPAMVLIK